MDSQIFQRRPFHMWHLGVKTKVNQGLSWAGGETVTVILKNVKHQDLGMSPKITVLSEKPILR